MSTRREAREHVMQALYAHEQSGGDANHIVHTLLNPKLDDDPKTRTFAEDLFRTTLDVMDTVDDIIRAHAANWDLERITAVDRALLRMATTELLEFEEIPPKVSIDEAIEIGKSYSTEDSGPFINGVLDSIVMDLHRQGRLEKSGRGLVGMDSIRERAQSE